MGLKKLMRTMSLESAMGYDECERTILDDPFIYYGDHASRGFRAEMTLSLRGGHRQSEGSRDGSQL